MRTIPTHIKLLFIIAIADLIASYIYMGAMTVAFALFGSILITVLAVKLTPPSQGDK